MRVGTTALLATVAALLTGAGAAQAADGCRAPRSWWAGGTALCHGTLVHGDYVDDDFGADTGAAMTTARTALLAPSAGDQGYPPGQDATADLVRLTVEPRGDRLVVTALLNALYDPRSTVLAVAIDTDDDPATGGGPWPGLRVRSSGWDEFTALDAGDPATNTIRGTVPRPAGRAWRLQAATAIRATGQVMNVAFRGTGEHAGWTLRSGLASAAGTWFEDDQAAALRTGDISRFGLHVDARDLRARVTRPATAGPGLHERVYTSAYTVAPGEGVRVAGVPGRGDGGPNVQAFQYLGRFQPYGVYVPPGPGPHGLQLVAHVLFSERGAAFHAEHLAPAVATIAQAADLSRGPAELRSYDPDLIATMLVGTCFWHGLRETFDGRPGDRARVAREFTDLLFDGLVPR